MITVLKHKVLVLIFLSIISCTPSKTSSDDPQSTNDSKPIETIEETQNPDSKRLDAFIAGVIRGEIKPDSVVPQIDPTIEIEYDGKKDRLFPEECVVISDGKEYPCPTRNNRFL